MSLVKKTPEGVVGLSRAWSMCSAQNSWGDTRVLGSLSKTKRTPPPKKKKTPQKKKRKRIKRRTHGTDGEGERDLVEDPRERFEEPSEIEDFCYGRRVDEAGEDVGEGY